MVAVDAEYVDHPVAPELVPVLGENTPRVRTLLSYQFSVVDPLDDSMMVRVVFLCLGRHRLRLFTALRVVWEEAGLWNHPLVASDPQMTARGVHRDSFWDDERDVTRESTRSPEQRRWNRLHKHGVPLILAAHYGKADLTAFYIGPGCVDHVRQVTSAAGGYVTLEPFRVRGTTSKHNDGRWWLPFSIVVSDSVAHAPADKRKLSALGVACGQPKVELPPGAISRMDLYLRDHPLDFLHYASSDPVVVIEYFERLYGAGARPPVTLSSGAAIAFRSSVMTYWDRSGLDVGSRDAFMLRFGGLVKSDGETVQSESGRSYYEQRGLEPYDGSARTVIDYCANAYHGGLNLCPIPGYYPGSNTQDYDLQSAYPTAMALVRDVDWAHEDGVIEETIENRELTLDDVPDPLTPFTAWVSFEFPEDVLFPCLPIFTDGCPMYVRTSEGRTGAPVMGPEVHLALKLGAKVFCQRGYRLRELRLADGSPSFALRAGVVQMVKDRAAAKAVFGKKSLEELAIKTMANSCYGKTAQDVAQQNAWDAHAQEMDSVGGSAITSPYHAATTTSFVRGQLLAAANELSSLGYRFFSVTTDGFITDAPPDVVHGLGLHGLAAVAADSRAILADGDRTIWEVKHRQEDLLNITTRGNVALNEGGVLAKNSFRSPEGVHESGGERRHFFDLVVSRSGRIPNPVKVFPSHRELSCVRGRADFVARINNRSLSMDFDCKRRPDLSRLTVEHAVDSDGVAHEVASFPTLPWETIDDCLRGRQVAKSMADGGCIRTAAQWRAWSVRFEHGDGHRIADVNRSILLSILIGHRQRLVGFDVPALSAPGRSVGERLDWLSGWGLGVVKESDWKNARRPDRAGQVLAPSACEPYLSVIRNCPVETAPRDLTGGGDTFDDAERIAS